MYQAALAPSVPIDPLHLPWIVYAYGVDGFAREHPVPRNSNLMVYPFLLSTLMVSSLLLFSLLLLF